MPLLTVSEMRVRWQQLMSTEEVLNDWGRLRASVQHLSPEYSVHILDLQLRQLLSRNYPDNKTRLHKAAYALLVNDALAHCVPDNEDLARFSPTIKTAIENARGRNNPAAQVAAAANAFRAQCLAQDNLQAHTEQQEKLVSRAVASSGLTLLFLILAGILAVGGHDVNDSQGNTNSLAASSSKKAALVLGILDFIPLLFAFKHLWQLLFTGRDRIATGLRASLATANQNLATAMQNFETVMRTFGQNSSAAVPGNRTIGKHTVLPLEAMGAKIVRARLQEEKARFEKERAEKNSKNQENKQEEDKQEEDKNADKPWAQTCGCCLDCESPYEQQPEEKGKLYYLLLETGHYDGAYHAACLTQHQVHKPDTNLAPLSNSPAYINANGGFILYPAPALLSLTLQNTGPRRHSLPLALTQYCADELRNKNPITTEPSVLEVKDEKSSTNPPANTRRHSLSHFFRAQVTETSEKREHRIDIAAATVESIRPANSLSLA